MVNKEEILKLKLLLSEVTEGPWVSIVEGRDQESGSSFIKTGDKDYDINFDSLKIVDQDFIALARNMLPSIIDEIEKIANL